MSPDSRSFGGRGRSQHRLFRKQLDSKPEPCSTRSSYRVADCSSLTPRATQVSLRARNLDLRVPDGSQRRPGGGYPGRDHAGQRGSGSRSVGPESATLPEGPTSEGPAP
jgi:hypothetical protein